MRTPRLFLEAKSLGENLDDRRWANQIMGYASVAGVQWMVLSDGNEYRIYNTHAPVSVEEKLFRTIRLTEETPLAMETLRLLAKDRMEENWIEVLWRSQFVDRQVRAAIEQLFTGEGDLLLVNYVAQRTKNLTPEEIRASLGRCQATLDFPTPSEVPGKRKRGARKARKPAAPSPDSATKHKGARSSVSLADLIQAGLLHPPAQLEREYKGRRLVARIEPGGQVSCLGKTYDSPSMAGGAARASVIGLRAGGKLPATNGWTFWQLEMPGDGLVELDVIRQRYEARSTSRAQRPRRSG